MNVAVLGTSAPHFPVETAKNTYRDCFEALKKLSDFKFFKINNIITDTFSSEDELKGLKKLKPSVLILIQGAFTWDNITVFLYEYFGKIPVILWVVPERNFSSGVLTTNSLCGAIMNNAVFHKLNARAFFCYGRPDDSNVIKQLSDILDRAVAAPVHFPQTKALRYGMVGYRPTGFYNSTFDELKIRKELGIETVHYDLISLLADAEHISAQRIKKDIDSVKKTAKTGKVGNKSLGQASKIYLALKDFISKEKIDFLGVKCWPEMMQRAVNPCMVLGRLTMAGTPAACESDFGGALSMHMAKQVSGNAPWLADLVEVNDKNKSFYFWHCGAAPACLVHKRDFPSVNAQFRGADRGLAMEFILKEGEVTVLRFGITDDRYRVFVFEGKAVFPDIRIRGNISEIVPYRRPEQILSNIIKHGVEHHFAITYGRHSGSLKNLAKSFGIDFYSA